MRRLRVFYLLLWIVPKDYAFADEDNRPYEFSFNLVDFQHRYEKKDKEGLISGEFGFITADGVYHETGYATDKDGDFIITKMRNRKITSLKDAQEIFKDKPEVAKKLVEALEKSCGGCKVPVKNNETETLPEKKGEILQKPMLTFLAEKMKEFSTNKNGDRRGQSPNESSSKTGVRDRNPPGKVLEGATTKSGQGTRNDVSVDNSRESKSLTIDEDDRAGSPGDLFYRFNYSISTHGHQEAGYRNGNKDGEYRAPSVDGVDARVAYLSNEFGHQPNITFRPRDPGAGDDQRLHGYAFRWYWRSVTLVGRDQQLRERLKEFFEGDDPGVWRFRDPRLAFS